jgi:beta-1,3-galactosyltransferase 1
MFKHCLVLFVLLINLISPDETYNEELKLHDVIVNPHNFSFVINPGEKICTGKSILAVFYVHTAPKNYKKRLAIRETWGCRKEFPKKGLIFSIGLTLNQTENEIISLENEKYGDIVQFDFIDDYKNLTYKAIMTMKWISLYCPQAKFIVKTDDDVVVDMHFLYRILVSRIENNFPLKRTIFCNILKKQKVSRDYYNWWYVEKSEYSAEYYGPYCSGMAFIATIDMASLIYNASFYMNYFWIDDYFITGALSRNLNTTYVSLGKWITYIDGYAKKYVKGIDIGDFIFTLTVNSIDDMYIIWSHLNDFYIFDQDKKFFSN